MSGAASNDDAEKSSSDFAEKVRALPDYDQHEQVLQIKDAASGLDCVIAIHNSARGPGVGGCRLWAYADADMALTDALRLSRGMTYKNALAELPFGGGKAVITAPDFARVDRRALFAAFGRAVEQAKGAYCTAEDVGTNPDDMAVIAEHTQHTFGLAHTSGDPSPLTAYGVFLGLRAAVVQRLATDSLRGVRVLVQGLGHVGFALCEQLHAAGADLIVNDVRPELMQHCQELFAAAVVSAEALYGVDADVYAPCALGATINPLSLEQLKVTVIAGAANNQLATDAMATALAQRNILYAPDFAINAGGIINIACEADRSVAYDATVARRAVEKIGPRLSEIFSRAAAQQTNTLIVAQQMAEERFTRKDVSIVRNTQLDQQAGLE